MGVESNGEVDKDDLYGTFNESVRNNQRFANKAAHKALDLPWEDEMQINTTTNNYGGKSGSMGTIAKIAFSGLLVATGAGAGIGIPLLIDALKDKPAPVAPAPTTDNDTKFDLELVE